MLQRSKGIIGLAASRTRLGLSSWFGRFLGHRNRFRAGRSPVQEKMDRVSALEPLTGDQEPRPMITFVVFAGQSHVVAVVPTARSEVDPRLLRKRFASLGGEKCAQ